MKIPLHTFEVSSPSEKDFIRLLQSALNRLPSVVEREISEADRFRFRLSLFRKYQWTIFKIRMYTCFLCLIYYLDLITF